MHLAPDVKEIYKTQSYAIQSNDRMKKINVTKLDDVYTDKFIMDINKVKTSRKLNNSEDFKLTNSDIEVLECQTYWIKKCFDKINIHEIGRF